MNILVKLMDRQSTKGNWVSNFHKYIYIFYYSQIIHFIKNIHSTIIILLCKKTITFQNSLSKKYLVIQFVKKLTSLFQKYTDLKTMYLNGESKKTLLQNKVNNI
jgi:hypothetical protein